MSGYQPDFEELRRELERARCDLQETMDRAKEAIERIDDTMMAITPIN